MRTFQRGVADREFVAEIEALADAIIDTLENGEDAREQLERLATLTGTRYDAAELRMVPGSTGTRHFAELAALGPAPLVRDLTRDEITHLVHLVSEPSSHVQYYLNILENGLPNADISDLIFHPDRERNAEEIADEALLRVKIFQQGGLSALRAHFVNLADAVRANPAAPLWAQDWARRYRLR